MFSKTQGFIVPCFSDKFTLKGLNAENVSIRFKCFGEYETLDISISEFGEALSLMSSFDFSDLLALMNEFIELDHDIANMMQGDTYTYEIVGDIAYKAERRGETNMRIINMREQVGGFRYHIFEYACKIYCALYDEDYKYFE